MKRAHREVSNDYVGVWRSGSGRCGRGTAVAEPGFAPLASWCPGHCDQRTEP
jgi:hypothetical protein